MDSIKLVTTSFETEYRKTPLKLKIIDCFLVFAVLSTAIQVLYMSLVGTFPFNSFLAGVLCSIGFFVTTVCLRMQVDPDNQDYKGLLPERAFADYVLCNCLLFLVVWNFMG